MKHSLSSYSSARVSCWANKRIFLLVCFFIDLNLSAVACRSPVKSEVFQAKAMCRVLRLRVTRRLSRWSTHSPRNPRRVRKWAESSGVAVTEARVNTCLLRKKERRARWNWMRLLAMISKLRLYPISRLIFLKILPFLPASSCTVKICSFPAFLRFHSRRREFSCLAPSSQVNNFTCYLNLLTGSASKGKRAAALSACKADGLWASPAVMAPSM